MRNRAALIAIVRTLTASLLLRFVLILAQVIIDVPDIGAGRQPGLLIGPKSASDPVQVADPAIPPDRD